MTMVASVSQQLDDRAMDLSIRTESEDGAEDTEVERRRERYDAYGAMDLSSSCSSSLQEEEDREDVSRKRKAEDMPRLLRTKKDKLDSESHEDDEEEEEEDAEDLDVVKVSKNKDSNGVTLKTRNKRRNIKEVLDQRLLHTDTKAAQEQENLRLTRLRENRKKVLEAFVVSENKKEDSDSILLESSDEDDKRKGLITIPSSDSDECRIVSDQEEEDGDDEDPNNSGMHVNDALNVRSPDGSVLINLGHPSADPDILLAPQIAACVKPHQIGGLRFLYDNVVESLSRFKSSPGFGCILAHNMGLGKTMQIVSFVDLFLESTESQKVLCIVPINTIQNWVAEFNYWLPAQGAYSKISERSDTVKNRKFKIHVLNDSLKNLGQRAAVISAWDKVGGVLLMGYELYRQLANRRQRRRRCKRGPQCVDLEEEDKNKKLLNDIQSALVNPGPDLVICDEGHRIKNSHASISQALKQIKTHRRVVLTGYPLQNNLMEYWCMVDFVRPNFLGNKTEFSNMFERPIQNGQCIDSTPKDVRLMKHRAHVLHEQLKGFVQRRGHVVLKDSLPEKTEHVLFIRLTEIQRRLYRRFMEELISNRCVSNPLKAFAVCCKIWNHPDVLYNFLKRKEEIDIDFDPEEFIDIKTKNGRGEEDDLAIITEGKKEEINYDWAQGMLNGYEAEKESHSNKLTIFLGLLEETVLCGDRLLLFSQSLCTLNLIEAFLQKRTVPKSKDNWSAGVNYYRLDGSTSALERERLINGFNSDPSVKLFLVSTRAGSLGVNLVGANRVVIFDASWNPCHDTQAVCRVYRYGQTKETHVYRLVTDNSLEKKIYDRQVNKQGMSDRIVDELNPDAHLSSKEVHSLICEEEADPPPADLQLAEQTGAVAYKDQVLNTMLRRHGAMLTKAPFSHESLLVDRKDNKLSKAEKKLAERAYKLEKTSKITYSRPSYAAFYPKQGTFATNLHNPGSNGFTRNRYYENGRKLDTWISPYSSASPAAAANVRPVASVRPLLQQSEARTVDGASYGSPPSPPSTWASNNQQPEHCKSTLIDTFPVPSFSNVLTSPPKSATSVYSEWNKKCSASASTAAGSAVSGGGRSSAEGGSVIHPVVARGGKLGSTTSSSSSSSSSAASPKPGLSTNNVLEALSKQGVGIQQVTVPKDLVIPTNPNEPPISLRAGQPVMVIKTPKGVYLRMEEKIIKIKQQVTVNGLFGNLSC